MEADQYNRRKSCSILICLVHPSLPPPHQARDPEHSLVEYHSELYTQSIVNVKLPLPAPVMWRSAVETPLPYDLRLRPHKGTVVIRGSSNEA